MFWTLNIYFCVPISSSFTYMVYVCNKIQIRFYTSYDLSRGWNNQFIMCYRVGVIAPLMARVSMLQRAKPQNPMEINTNTTCFIKWLTTPPMGCELQLYLLLDQGLVLLEERETLRATKTAGVVWLSWTCISQTFSHGLLTEKKYALARAINEAKLWI